MSINVECPICMEEKHDFVFLKCSICRKDICFLGLDHIQTKNCPFCRSDYRTQSPFTAWTHFWREFDIQPACQVIHLFSPRYVSRIFIPRDWNIGFFNYASSPAGRCENQDFAKQMVHFHLECIILKS